MRNPKPPNNLDHLLVVDFEATCCNRGTITKKDVEIIELGAVLVSWPSLETTLKFQRFIRPVKKPKLTRFCTKLTGIEQSQVDKAETFPKVIKHLKKEVLRERAVIFCCWSPFDWKQINRDCLAHEIDNPFTQGYWDLQRMFRKQQRLPRNMGLSKAIELVNLDFIGSPHRGIDDAINTSRLLPFCIPGDWLN